MKGLQGVRVWAGMVLMVACVNTASASGGGGEGGGSLDTLPLEPLVVNLKDQRYIQLKPVIKLTDPLDSEVVKGWTPLLRHELIKYLIGRDPKEASSPQFMKAFSEDVAELFNKVLRREYIKNVIFDSWIVQ